MTNNGKTQNIYTLSAEVERLRAENEELKHLCERSHHHLYYLIAYYDTGKANVDIVRCIGHFKDLKVVIASMEASSED